MDRDGRFILMKRTCQERHIKSGTGMRSLFQDLSSLAHSLALGIQCYFSHIAITAIYIKSTWLPVSGVVCIINLHRAEPEACWKASINLSWRAASIVPLSSFFLACLVKRGEKNPPPTLHNHTHTCIWMFSAENIQKYEKKSYTSIRSRFFFIHRL